MAFSRASRIRRYVKLIATQLRLSYSWQIELAAMLSQVGCIAISPTILEKIYAGKLLSIDEQKTYSSYPFIGSKLVASIPRLGPIAGMIEKQQPSFDAKPPIQDVEEEDMITMGAQILKIAIAFDQMQIRGLTPDFALSEMRQRPQEYNSQVVAALGSIQMGKVEDMRTGGPDKADDENPRTIRRLEVQDIQVGMVTHEDIQDKSGILLVPAGEEITKTILQRLRISSQERNVKEPVSCYVGNVP